MRAGVVARRPPAGASPRASPLARKVGLLDVNLLTSVLTLCGWTLWGYIVLSVDPVVPTAPLAFYGALFVALTCTLGRLLGGPSSSDTGEGRPSQVPSLGHAAIVSTLILFALWLQSLRMLTPLNGILLAAMFLFIELGFTLSGGGRRKPRARRRTGRVPAPGRGLAGEPPGM